MKRGSKNARLTERTVFDDEEQRRYDKQMSFVESGTCILFSWCLDSVCQILMWNMHVCVCVFFFVIVCFYQPQLNNIQKFELNLG